MARNKKGREINGILLLDKEKGISSNFALQQVKRLFFAKKAGHTGSLDPLATGILPICLGEATKFAKFLLADDKSYQVVAKLGQTTTTLDSEGEITSTATTQNITLDLVKQTIKQFIGEIEQIPPMYSALKKDGVPLYKLARAGKEIEREARKITIFNIDLISFENDLLTLSVQCSKGTYIRTLVDDIGRVLGCGAFVSELRRDKFAHLDLSQTIKFTDLKQDSDYENLDAQLLSIDSILPQFNKVYLNPEQEIDLSFGRQIKLQEKIENTDLVKIFADDKLLGVGEIVDNILQPKRLIV